MAATLSFVKRTNRTGTATGRDISLQHYHHHHHHTTPSLSLGAIMAPPKSYAETGSPLPVLNYSPSPWNDILISRHLALSSARQTLRIPPRNSSLT